jgi:DNA repair exonuclease SbcCD nuclease subunit
MKYLVTGDLHIKTGRLSEIQSVLNTIVTTSKQCDATIICGDVFDGDCPKPAEIDMFIDFILRLCAVNKVYLISGNHGILKTGVNSEMWAHRLSNNLVYNETSLVITDSNKSILVEHRAYKESKFNASGFSNETESCLGLKYDIVLLGHIHKYQIVNKASPLVIHAGTPYYVTFGEVEDKKGVVILDVDINHIFHSFVEFDGIPMYSFIVDEYNLDMVDSALTYIPKRSKLRLTFNLNSNSLDSLSTINRLISKYKAEYHEFKYTMKSQEIQYTQNNDVCKKDIIILFDEFCVKEHVDSQLKEDVRRLL